jgi:hypothetical protein
LRLDGGRFGVTLLGDGAEQLGREAEILERRFDETLLMFIRREDLKGRSLCKPLLKSAWEGLEAFAPVQAEKLLGKFGELGKNREGAVTLTG